MGGFRALRFVAVIAAAAALIASAGGAQAGGGAPRWKAWLCLPNAPNNYCYIDLTTTVISADGSKKQVKLLPTSTPAIDCFYVYPTVSQEKRGNSDLVVHSEERNTAIIQAARFSQVCRMFAPMYRQTTANAGLFKADYDLPYQDVLAAWKDYLAHYNKGRGVVLIGHSAGAYALKHLIQDQIDGTPERKLLVSAILLGGSVSVADGSTMGGDFKHTPACTSLTSTGCIVAYSSWSRTPPKDANFEEVDKPATQHILCVNPAAPGGGSAPITPIFTGFNSEGIAVTTTAYQRYLWVEFPGLYSARCVQQGSRAWLLVSRIKTPGDTRPSVQEVLAPGWGLHAADVNIALGSLVSLVQSQARAWLAHR